MKINSSSLLVNTPDVDECLAWTFDCEDDSQMCENTYGSYKCVCAEGLYWIDGQCKGETDILNHCDRRRLFTTRKVLGSSYPPTFLPPFKNSTRSKY